MVVNVDDDIDADAEFYVKQEPGTTQESQTKHYLFDHYNRIECTECIQTFDNKERAFSSQSPVKQLSFITTIR